MDAPVGKANAIRTHPGLTAIGSGQAVAALAMAVLGIIPLSRQWLAPPNTQELEVAARFALGVGLAGAIISLACSVFEETAIRWLAERATRVDLLDSALDDLAGTSEAFIAEGPLPREKRLLDQVFALGLDQGTTSAGAQLDASLSAAVSSLVAAAVMAATTVFAFLSIPISGALTWLDPSIPPLTGSNLGAVLLALGLASIVAFLFRRAAAKEFGEVTRMIRIAHRQKLQEIALSRRELAAKRAKVTAEEAAAQEARSRAREARLAEWASAVGDLVQQLGEEPSRVVAPRRLALVDRIQGLVEQPIFGPIMPSRSYSELRGLLVSMARSPLQFWVGITEPDKAVIFEFLRAVLDRCPQDLLATVEEAYRAYLRSVVEAQTLDENVWRSIQACLALCESDATLAFLTQLILREGLDRRIVEKLGSHDMVHVMLTGWLTRDRNSLGAWEAFESALQSKGLVGQAKRVARHTDQIKTGADLGGHSVVPTRKSHPQE